MQRFFKKTNGHYQISKSIRDMFVFARQNVTRDPPFSQLDLISCRNLLIYFDPALQKRAISLFHYALNPGGFLMLGPSETIGASSDFFSLADNKKFRIFTKNAVRPQSHLEYLPCGVSTRSGLPPDFLTAGFNNLNRKDNAMNNSKVTSLFDGRPADNSKVIESPFFEIARQWHCAYVEYVRCGDIVAPLLHDEPEYRAADAAVTAAAKRVDEMAEQVRTYPATTLLEAVIKARVGEIDGGSGYVGGGEDGVSRDHFALIRDLERMAGIETPSADAKAANPFYGFELMLKGIAKLAA